jgi:prepilin-type N-terminal cleavage/methylation domain-containing protein
MSGEPKSGIAMSDQDGSRRQENDQRGGFTLVELLVVIAIIALLIALLLPTLANVGEVGRRTQCQNNLRQIAIGIQMYCHANAGDFPCGSQKGMTLTWRAWDWIHWQTKPYQRQLNESSLAPYLSRPINPSILRCPSDVVESHRSGLGFGGEMDGAYFYSYSANRFMVTPILEFINQPAKIRWSGIRNPSEKVMLVEEDVTSLNDGLWDPVIKGGTGCLLSTRHDRRAPRPEIPAASSTRPPNAGARGNAAYADTHVAFITRAEAHNARHYDPRWPYPGMSYGNNDHGNDGGGGTD